MTRRLSVISYYVEYKTRRLADSHWDSRLLLLLCFFRYQSNLGNNNKRVDLFDMGAGSSEPAAEDNIQMASREISC
jgi:hypothetical protein